MGFGVLVLVSLILHILDVPTLLYFCLRNIYILWFINEKLYV